MSFHITDQTIKKEWTDYNNHMNMAYYVLIFDQTWEIILEKFKMGEKSAKDTQRSTMVVETRTTYDGEVKEGDEVIGNETRVKVVKNKVSPPFKQAEFQIMYGMGINQEGEILDYGNKLGLIDKSGAFYKLDGETIGQGKTKAGLFSRKNEQSLPNFLQ